MTTTTQAASSSAPPLEEGNQRNEKPRSRKRKKRKVSERMREARLQAQVVKDPAHAIQYLRAWKHNQLEKDGDWKFSKNTQSWLLRHMYQADLLPKDSFSLLLDYLGGLQGSDTKKRMLDDATRRVLRYKEFEKASSSNEAATESENADKTEEENEAQSEDAIRWSTLDAHDKRKEYKRARQVLEKFS